MSDCILCDKPIGRALANSGAHVACRDKLRETLQMKARLDTLASNLAIGAALCRAYWLGQDVILEHETWHPGCQREAP